MHPISLLLSIFREKTRLDEATFQNAVSQLVQSAEQSENKIFVFLRKPAVILALGLFVPVLKSLFDRIWDRFIGDQDGDGDSDINDLIMKLAAKQLLKKGIELPQSVFDYES